MKTPESLERLKEEMLDLSFFETSSFDVQRQLQRNAIVPATMLGIASFSSTLALSTLLQHRILHISTGTRAPIPTLLGVTTITLASLVTHFTTTSSMQYFQTKQLPQSISIPSLSNMMPNKYNSSSSDRLMIPYTSYSIPKVPSLQILLLGLLSFPILGGRFWTISPSSYTRLGSFARPRFSLPATLDSYASSSQRIAIENLGRRFGCHTCGSKQIISMEKVKFHADHMPPTAITKRMNKQLWRKLLKVPVKQRFYPQCVKCSHQQGKILSSGTVMKDWVKQGKTYWGRKHALSYCHAGKFRWSHFGTGSVLAGASVYLEKEESRKK